MEEAVLRLVLVDEGGEGSDFFQVVESSSVSVEEYLQYTGIQLGDCFVCCCRDDFQFFGGAERGLGFFLNEFRFATFCDGMPLLGCGLV